MSVEPDEVAWRATRVGESVLLEIEDPGGTSDYLLTLEDAAIVAALIIEALGDDADVLGGPDGDPRAG